MLRKSWKLKVLIALYTVQAALYIYNIFTAFSQLLPLKIILWGTLIYSNGIKSGTKNKTHPVRADAFKHNGR